MAQHLFAAALLVHDYDEAKAFFTQALRFTVDEDRDQGGGKRWLTLSPSGGGARLLLARASNDEQRAQVGHHAGGRVGLFLHTTDFRGDHAHMSQAGVRFVESPRTEAYGTVAVFLDLYGNRWDLIEPA
jgi:predicted enzyme related to lactoylglutathione lyase